MGDWDLRSLVGHASRSLTTVSTYLQTTAEREDVATPHGYYAMVNPAALGIDPAAIVERGRQAGEGPRRRPGGGRRTAWSSACLRDLDGVDNRLIKVIGGRGIRLFTYLPTRIFELAVHGLDIAGAVGISLELPDDVLAEAVMLAGRIAAAAGHGETVLLALTGRTVLPPSFSVV